MYRLLISLFRRTETRALLIWFGAAAAIWAFLEIADEVGEGEIPALDQHLLLMVREPGDPADPLGSRTFEEAMRDVTALGGFTFLTLLTVVAVLAFAFHRKRIQATILAVTVLIAQWANGALKTFYGRPRPDLVPHGSYVYSESFPSGHSTLAAVTFLTLATMIASLEARRSLKVMAYVVAMLLTAAVGASRVYLGVHWPSDVLAGWSIGAAFAFVAWIALDLARRRAGAQNREATN